MAVVIIFTIISITSKQVHSLPQPHSTRDFIPAPCPHNHHAVLTLGRNTGLCAPLPISSSLFCCSAVCLLPSPASCCCSTAICPPGLPRTPPATYFQHPGHTITTQFSRSGEIWPRWG
jgi:hypothetical protein